MTLTRPQRLAVLRVSLSTLGTLAGLFLPLDWLRSIHINALTLLLHFSGVTTDRLSQFVISVHSTPLQVTNACTSIEVALSAIPLIYQVRWQLHRSLLLLGSAIILFEALNIARLYLGLYFYAHGFSWNVTHTVPSGVFLFLILYPVLRYGGWVERDSVKYMVLKLPDSAKNT